MYSMTTNQTIVNMNYFYTIPQFSFFVTCEREIKSSFVGTLIHVRGQEKFLSCVIRKQIAKLDIKRGKITVYYPCSTEIFAYTLTIEY